MAEDSAPPAFVTPRSVVPWRRTMARNLIIALAAGREFWFFMGWDKREFVAPRLRPHVEVAAMALVIVVCVFFRGPGSQFIYFQF